MTPLRRITGVNELARYRRILGLAAFGYATLHFLIYLALDRFLELGEIAADIMKRPYITVGFAAFLLLVALALTSTRTAIRRLGPRWTALHRLVYPAAILAVLHFYWKKSAKADVSEPLIFAAVIGLLLASRLYRRRTRITPAPRARAADRSGAHTSQR